MTDEHHERWCTHHHHVEPTNDLGHTEGGTEDWCCYRGPRDTTGRRIEISGHNRFIGVTITDWVYPAGPMTEAEARELVAGIEAALLHVQIIAQHPVDPVTKATDLVHGVASP